MLVAIVVDQLAAWVADERLPHLPADGGFARLTREGTWLKELRLPYAVTDTGPGHAALYTGLVPAETHVVVNELPDEATGRRRSAFIDPTTDLVTPSERVRGRGSSARTLQAKTLADRLRDARPDAIVVSVSLKDRAALLPAGQRPTHALWFDPARGSFVTSTAIEPGFPAWARGVGDEAAVRRAMAQPWTPHDRGWLERLAGADDAPGEGDFDGLGVSFPHEIKTARALRATPMADGLVLSLLLAAARATRRPGAPLLLCASLSANDVIGHVFGPDSWEAWDELRRLDAALARFFVDLESIVGPFSVLLSGDHGIVSMPEARLPLPATCLTGERPVDRYQRPRCVRGSRLDPERLRAELRAETARALGDGDLVTGIADGYVFLSRAGRALDGARRDTLDSVVRRVLLGEHGDAVADVFSSRDLNARCPALLAGDEPRVRARASEPLVKLVCRSWADVGAGAAYLVVPAHGSFFDGETVPGKGSSHGTPYLHDRSVPLFVRPASQLAAARGRIRQGPIDVAAFAGVGASLLGLDPRSVDTILDGLLDQAP